MLDKLRLGPKLLLAPCLMLILLSALSGRAYFAMARRTEAMERAAVLRAARLKSAAELAGAARYAHGNLYQLLAWRNGGVAPARCDALARRIGAQQDALAQQLAALGAQAGAAERRRLDDAQRLLPAYLAAAQATIALARADARAAIASMTGTEQQFTLFNAQLDALAALESTLGELARLEARRALDGLGKNLAAMVLLSLALSLLVALPVRRALLRAVRDIADAAARLAAGDLRPRPAPGGCDEIAQAARMLERAIAALDQTMRTMHGAARAIDAASGELAACGPARPERHAGLAPVVLGSMELAQRRDAELARALAAEVRALARGASVALCGTLEAIDGLRANTRKISAIVGEIDVIASQTRLLAMNAAVQAAQAGAQGGTLAVLAGELRALARRSADAAAQIAALNAGGAATDGAARPARAAGDSLARIAAAAGQLDGLGLRMARQAARQAGDSAALRLASVQMGRALRRRSVQAGRAAAAAADLQEQARRLSGALERFYAGARTAPADSEQAETDRRAPSSPMRGGDNADRRHRAGCADGE